MNNQLLKVEDLSLRFGYKKVFENLNFVIEPGECALLMGVNGAGKTSLLKSILGLQKTYSGKSSFQVEESNTRRYQAFKNIGFIGHELMVYPDLTVIENLTFSAKLNKINNYDTLINNALKDLDLVKYKDFRLADLSAGLMKRVSIGQTYIQNPSLILLDEPYSSLDFKFIEKMNDWLREKTLSGAAILLTSHQIQECFDLINKILILSNSGINTFDRPKTIDKLETLYKENIY